VISSEGFFCMFLHHAVEGSFRSLNISSPHTSAV
jgi:hypothetical protein